MNLPQLAVNKLLVGVDNKIVGQYLVVEEYLKRGDNNMSQAWDKLCVKWTAVTETNTQQ